MWKKSYTKDIDIDVSVTFRLTAVFDSTFTHARAHRQKRTNNMELIRKPLNQC